MQKNKSFWGKNPICNRSWANNELPSNISTMIWMVLLKPMVLILDGNSTMLSEICNRSWYYQMPITDQIIEILHINYHIIKVPWYEWSRKPRRDECSINISKSFGNKNAFPSASSVAIWKGGFQSLSQGEMLLREAAKIVLFSVAWPVRGRRGGGKGLATKKKIIFFEARKKSPEIFLWPLSSRGDV